MPYTSWRFLWFVAVTILEMLASNMLIGHESFLSKWTMLYLISPSEAENVELSASSFFDDIALVSFVISLFVVHSVVGIAKGVVGDILVHGTVFLVADVSISVFGCNQPALKWFDSCYDRGNHFDRRHCWCHFDCCRFHLAFDDNFVNGVAKAVVTILIVFKIFIVFPIITFVVLITFASFLPTRPLTFWTVSLSPRNNVALLCKLVHRRFFSRWVNLLTLWTICRFVLIWTVYENGNGRWLC